MVICVILEIKIPINKSPCSPPGMANKLGLVLHLYDKMQRPNGMDATCRSLHMRWFRLVAAADGALDRRLVVCSLARTETRAEGGEIVHFLTNNGQHTRFTPSARGG